MFIGVDVKKLTITLLFTLLISLAFLSIFSNYLLYKIIWKVYESVALRFTEKLFYSEDLRKENIKDKTKILIVELQTVAHNYLLAKSILVSRSILVLISVTVLLFINLYINGLILLTVILSGSFAYLVARYQLKLVGVQRLYSSEKSFSIITSILSTALHLRSFRPFKKHMVSYLQPHLKNFAHATSLNSFIPVIPRSIIEFSFFSSLLIFIALPNSLNQIDPFWGLISIFLFVRLLPLVIIILRTSGEIAFAAPARFQLEEEWSRKPTLAVPQIKRIPKESFYTIKVQLVSTGDKIHYLKLLKNRINVITGESGIGKSTILNALHKIKSSNLSSIEASQFQDLKINMAPQKGEVLPWASARDNLFLNSGMENEIEKRCNKLINELNLSQINLLSCDPIGELSGGQEKRLDLLRSILHPSDVLLLDEPTTGLDQKNIIAVLELLKNDSRTIIAVSHEAELIAIADNVVEISHDTKHKLSK